MERPSPRSGVMVTVVACAVAVIVAGAFGVMRPGGDGAAPSTREAFRKDGAVQLEAPALRSRSYHIRPSTEHIPTKVRFGVLAGFLAAAWATATGRPPLAWMPASGPSSPPRLGRSMPPRAPPTLLA